MLPNYELLLLNVSRNKRALSDYFGDSIGQHIIAEYIKRFGFVAKVYSGYVGDAKKVIKFEISEHNVPVIGFYCAADNIVTTLNLIKWIKKIYTDKKIVIGGPQAVAIDKKMFLENSIDYVIVGEGEIPMLKLMECIIDGYGELQEIPSLKYVKNNQMFINDIKGAIIHNLDNIPFPNFDNSLNSNFRKGKTIGLITGRGCPFNFAFCNEVANAKNVLGKFY